MNTEPTITQVWYDASIDGNVAEIDDWRTTDAWGREVEVTRFLQNGSTVTAKGHMIRKDGTPAARRVVLGVAVPVAVQAALASGSAR